MGELLAAKVTAEEMVMCLRNTPDWPDRIRPAVSTLASSKSFHSSLYLFMVIQAIVCSFWSPFLLGGPCVVRIPASWILDFETLPALCISVWSGNI